MTVSVIAVQLLRKALVKLSLPKNGS